MSHFITFETFILSKFRDAGRDIWTSTYSCNASNSTTNGEDFVCVVHSFVCESRVTDKLSMASFRVGGRVYKARQCGVYKARQCDVYKARQCDVDRSKATNLGHLSPLEPAKLFFTNVIIFLSIFMTDTVFSLFISQQFTILRFLRIFRS